MSIDAQHRVDREKVPEHEPVGAGHRVLIADDLLATCGTARAVVKLVERLGGQVTGLAFVIELEGLGGRQRLAPTPIVSLIRY